MRGDRLVDGPGAGQTVQLRGVSRSGLEYACIQGWGFFDSPHPDQVDSASMIAAMRSWRINAVRVPLNEDCWLGLGAPRRFSGAAYRRIVERYVRALGAARLYVILDLHWSSPRAGGATGQEPMADAAHAPAFWRSVARAFRGDHELIFDLFNEPFRIGWRCWRDGCEIPAGNGWPAYRAAGMQQLVDAVRLTGATQPLMLGGLDYAWDLRGWSANEPRDPLHQLVASEHNYGGLSPCGASCLNAVLATARHVPVVFGELGETDCGQRYVDAKMTWADAHGIGYLGWAWDAGGGWTCRGGPSLISSYHGAPTPYGAGLRDHLRALPPPILPALP
ncbi:MAG: glycoside hydrolase family 5 protein [Solirubrobacteraceae bacterium]